MADLDLNLIAYVAILLWLLFWTMRLIKAWTGGPSSIKSLLFLGCAWVGMIGAGMGYFAK